nr:hypothetical protein [Pedobacter sp. ASV19]
MDAEVNGEVWDSSRAIENDASVKLLTWNDTCLLYTSDAADER